jgi:hypothetical protein
VHIVAKNHARRGRAKTIGTSNASGGNGKKLASANEIKPSHIGARGEADSANMRA